MIIISFITQKGGSGKTTLTTSLAPYLQYLGLKILIIDTDPQGSAEFWYQVREESALKLIKIEAKDLEETIDTARNKNFDIILIDTAGRDEPSNLTVIRKSTFCVVPCRPTPADIKAANATVQAIKRLDKPFCFVLTQVNARGGDRIREAEIALNTLGLVSSVKIVSRNVYQDAQGAGLSPSEYDGNSRASAEIKELWNWLSNKIKKMCYE